MSLDQPKDFVKPSATTRDAFLGGRIIVTQFSRGFRAGLDSVLLGTSVRPEARTVLDLGAGVGTAALVAMARNPQLEATLAENDPEAVQLATGNIEGNGFAPRAQALALDVTAKGEERAAAGLRLDLYDSVIANPPYFDRDSGTAAAARGKAARQMPAAALDLWIKTAAACAAAGGEVIFIHQAAALPALLAGFDARFGGLTVLPLCPRPGEAANRILIRGIKGSRGPLTLLSALPLHLDSGPGFAPQIEALLRGEPGSIW